MRDVRTLLLGTELLLGHRASNLVSLLPGDSLHVILLDGGLSERAMEGLFEAIWYCTPLAGWGGEVLQLAQLNVFSILLKGWNARDTGWCLMQERFTRYCSEIGLLKACFCVFPSSTLADKRLT